MKNIFAEETSQELVSRINNLTPETTPQWGIMTVDQMLAHVNVAYDMSFTDMYPKPNFLMKWVLKKWVKDGVVNETPYPKNSKTAPQFIIKDRRDFEGEKKKPVDYIWKVQKMGKNAFEGREAHSFGAMTAQEWNNMFYKHLDHHLTQFGV